MAQSIEPPRCVKRNKDSACTAMNVAVCTDGLCGTARLYISRYDRIRNAYVYLLAEGAYSAIMAETGRQPRLVVSGHTFPGIGKFSAYWIPRRGSGMAGLKEAIRDLQLFNMLGIPAVGIAPCLVDEVRDEATLALCCMWIHLAAFLPITQVVQLSEARNGTYEERYSEAVQNSRVLRRKLLPHITSAVFKSATAGTMVLRPLHFEFPADPVTREQTTQFMLGDQLMVVPATEYKKRTPEGNGEFYAPIPVYLSAGVWYEWCRGKRLTISSGPLTHAPVLEQTRVALFLRGGGVLVAADPRGRTELIVALDADGSAYGEFMQPPAVIAANTISREQYSHFHFFFSKNFFAGSCSPCAMDVNVHVITALGLAEAPAWVEFGGRSQPFSFTHKVLRLSGGPFVQDKPFFMKIA